MTDTAVADTRHGRSSSVRTAGRLLLAILVAVFSLVLVAVLVAFV